MHERAHTGLPDNTSEHGAGLALLGAEIRTTTKYIARRVAGVACRRPTERSEGKEAEEEETRD